MSYYKAMRSMMKDQSHLQPYPSNNHSRITHQQKQHTFQNSVHDSHHQMEAQNEEWNYAEEEIDERKSRNFMYPKKLKTTKTLTDLLPVKVKMVREYQRKKTQAIHRQSQISAEKRLFETCKLPKQRNSSVKKQQKTKELESMLMINNQNLQQMNMEVMKRLLNIIENTQNTNLQLQLSKVTQYQSNDKRSAYEDEAQNKQIVINNILPRSNSKSKRSFPGLDRQLLKKEIQVDLLNKKKQESMPSPFGKGFNGNMYTQKIKIPKVQVVYSEKKFETEFRQNQPQESSLFNIDNFVVESYRQKEENAEKYSQKAQKNEDRNEGELQLESKRVNQKMSSEKQEKDKSQKKEKTEQRQVKMNTDEKIEEICEMSEKQPVFMEIPLNDSVQQISLAEAFAKKVGKLSSQSRQKSIKPPRNISNKKVDKRRDRKKVNKQNIEINTEREKINIQNFTTPMNKLQAKTPQSSQPSEDLMNRLIHGSKAKVSKKEMHALTKKNYEKLPQVLEKKNQQKKKELEFQRLLRIKEYQKSIRGSKSTITSQN